MSKAGERRSAEVIIPTTAVRHVIGHQGRIIKEIERSSGADRIRIDTTNRNAPTTTVTIQYREERQRAKVESKIREIVNNLAQVYTHPEVNMTLVVAGSLLESSESSAAVDVGSATAVSFIRLDTTNYGTGIRVTKPEPVEDNADDLVRDLNDMTIGGRSFDARNAIVVDQSVAERDKVEKRFAERTSKYGRDVLKLKPEMEWRVEIGIGQQLIYDMKRTNERSVADFQSSKIGRDKDFKMRFDNTIQDEQVDPLVQYLNDHAFELESDEEEIAMHLMDYNVQDRRVGVNVRVHREEKTLQPRFTKKRQKKPLFLTYQHAKLLPDDSVDAETLPRVPFIGARIRLQTNECTEKINDRLKDFVSKLETKAIWSANGMLRFDVDRSMRHDGVSLDSIRIKHIKKYSDGRHVVAMEKIHDEHGRDAHTEVTINSVELDIREQEEETVHNHIRDMLTFARELLSIVFTDK